MTKTVIVAAMLLATLTPLSAQESTGSLSSTATKNALATPSIKHSDKPKVPFKYGRGMSKYRTACSSCHGKWGDGTEQGPPLMHAYYKPSHHSDVAFYRAAQNGVKAHHWKFGDMPPAAGVTRKDMDKIIPFVRWMQKQKGI